MRSSHDANWNIVSSQCYNDIITVITTPTDNNNTSDDEVILVRMTLLSELLL